MKVQIIQNNNQSFKALKITPEARTIIEKQNGGLEKIAKYTSELANSKWDLTIKPLKMLDNDSIFPLFGDRRCAAVTPAHIKDNYVMVYSGDKFGDNEDNVVDCLKFKNHGRALEVFNQLEEFFYTSRNSVIKNLDWHVYAMKLFDEAEIVPQKDSPWAAWLRDYKTTPIADKKINTVTVEEEKKPSFKQKLKEAWKVLTK